MIGSTTMWPGWAYETQPGTPFTHDPKLTRLAL